MTLTKSITVTARIDGRVLEELEVGNMAEAAIVANDMHDTWEPEYGTAVEVTIE
ncbi:hypothetical protein [Rubinisphaera brasiliensis]|uniref:Uncharacterized protein n=1 Tax=Rubinisphaera brasiliensis (strain ATCC 49424 / DSM 5305 / JCM 21570 / IAM 15109 / NBRC 103401 / IFAM 1448) TaxID=756272 RepID=F0SNI1_RUBBR|nr:hypothetical protein [Rubinisphaera brasiliensis]ADY57815.1 hypothetical protein Plabr_0185 [Rubinisphaera brasiliensis DSM 5305]